MIIGMSVIDESPSSAELALYIAGWALNDAWEIHSAIARINEDASRLADELEPYVPWQDQWRGSEPHPNLSELDDYRTGRRPRKVRSKLVPASVVIPFTEAQRAQLRLLSEGGVTQAQLLRRLIDEHVEGSPLPTEERGGHSVRFLLRMDNPQRARLEHLAAAEKLSMAALVRVLVTRAAEGIALPESSV